MKQFTKSKHFLFVMLLLIVVSVVMGVVSFYPAEPEYAFGVTDVSFVLTPLETRSHGLGSFRGGENISILIRNPSISPLNFSIVTYKGAVYSELKSSDIEYSFTATSEYYEAIFSSEDSTAAEIQFIFSVDELEATYPFSFLNTPAKVLFLASLGSVMLLLLKPAVNAVSAFRLEKHEQRLLSQKGRRILLVLIILSIAFWFFLIAVNMNPLGTFENWYTDHARHSYSSTLFTKVGFSIFANPLGELASGDSSYYKFVTWPQMAHIYPLGSIFLFLPFGLLLQSGVNQILVFKLEIIVFLFFAHVSLYYFLERFWKQKMFPFLKLLGVYAMYIPLIVYAANGMFDALPLLFSLIAIDMFLAKRYDWFLLFMAVSVFFKYQPALFLMPFMILGVLKLFEQHRLSSLIRNKIVITAAILTSVAGITAVASAPFLINTKAEFVMNGVNAFSPHAQIPWELQSFAVFLTMVVTLLFAVYMHNRNPLISLSAIFILLPSFTMPFFQIWYLPFFFGYVLLPQPKRDMEATMLWLLFIMTMLAAGLISFNPALILEGWVRVLGL